ncbi:MAG: hypothetical protein ACLR23_17915 [Clostridia bacterium]
MNPKSGFFWRMGCGIRQLNVWRTASGFAIPSTELSPLLEEAKRAVEENGGGAGEITPEGLVIGIDPAIRTGD